ncbi:hypothetical protein INS49_010020 [Diaporthe citri]|uniref:uncharacterized protein n=1 Tax=Diaporthe citri TaxID=83186 RepID=UPI001C7FA4F6|nr:uncharacterized protein INS49_010020 [Diaporthe citri]KAG6361791.1 hypothetical protein INS49_010020 [Diaporthe citri]
MPVCDLCLTVPFTALPRLPQERRGLTTVADSAESIQVMFQAGDEITSPDAELPDQIGFPFHEDLEALALSARSCPVCNVAQTGVQGWIDRWEDAAKNSKSFIEFSLQREPIPTGQQLWLTACDDGEQGFFLWAKNPATPKYLYLLAAVRFYAEASIDIRETPQTFIDAVTIARRLGLRYLWIDSLCICQDDASDWARESSRMVDVYSNAHIVIAANRSDDCNGGIFHSRTARPKTVFKLPGGADYVHAMLLFQSDQRVAFTATEFPGEPLTRRGWALQERVLAKRIIHYNARQIYFECDQGIFAEDGSHKKERHCRLNDRLAPSLEISTGNSSDSLPDYEADLRLWDALVWGYGRRKLSKPTDRLPAISGLARLFHKRFGGQYVAGIWSKAMMEGLAWQGLGERAPASQDEYIGPSWSWASYAGIGAMGPNPGWVDIADILDWHVDLKHEANPFGEVEDAWVRIRGPAIQLRHSTLESNEHEARLGRAEIRPLPRVCTPYSESENGTIMKTDHADVTGTSEWKEWPIEVLLLGGYKGERGQESDSADGDADKAMSSLYGLVIRSAGDEQTGKMQRTGWMFLDGKEGSKIREDEKNWKTVTLV